MIQGEEGSMSNLSRLNTHTYTFLFTDLQSSTWLWEQFPTVMKDSIERHDAILRDAVEGSMGQVVKTTGDGLMAVFSSVLDGVDACLTAQIRMQKETWGETGPLLVRMGLHVGEAQPRGGDYYGKAVNRAARLMSAAHGGQVLLSGAAASMVVDLLPEGVTLRDLGNHRLKDLARPEHVYQLSHPNLDQEFPPLASLDLRANNLPAQPTGLIGREKELGEILNRLRAAEVRLLTLTGPGGIGKTRLALQAGAELIEMFADGVYFVDLSPIREPESVLAAITHTLHLRETNEQPLLEILKSHLQSKNMLMLLDNFEQVTKAGPYAAELLRSCPGLKLLVTSREALRVYGELVYTVPPLALPKIAHKLPSVEQLSQYEAVRLFIERAQSVKPDFKVTNENAPAVAEICIRLDGLPLAIELAAARTRLFSPQALLERLGDRLKLLQSGARDLPVRQQTLRDAIGWSYELLSPGEQRLFELLSVFSGGSSFEAIEAVSAGPGMVEHLKEQDVDILDGLTSLVEKSLIRQEDQESGNSRLLMLQTIREYAAVQLRAIPGYEAAAYQAHAGYFAGFVLDQVEPTTGKVQDSSSLEAAIRALGAEVENVQAAWRYWVEEKDVEQLGKLVDGLWLLYEARGWYQAMIEITNDLLMVLASVPPTEERIQQEITLQTGLARALLAVRGYTAEVEQAYQRALELSQKAGEPAQTFPFLRGLASYYLYQGRFEAAGQMGTKILGLADRLNDVNMRVEGYLVVGYNQAFLGDVTLGLQTMDKAGANYDPERFRRRGFSLGNSPGVVQLSVSAMLLWMRGFPERSITRANSAIDLAARLNHPYSSAYALYHASLLHLWRQETELSLKRAQDVLAIAEEHEYHVWKAVATCLHGAALAKLQQPKEGMALIVEGIRLYKALPSPPVFWPLLLHLQAEVYNLIGQPEEGLVVLDQALASAGSESESMFSSMFYRLKGDLLLSLSPDQPSQAEALFESAIEVASKWQMTMLELRAAIRLCRLWQSNALLAEAGAYTQPDKTRQCKKLLSSIYEKFSEGFNTSDLIEARELMAQ
jgi:predicted ATPase/class 3 adenylate cyclase